ncbi:MAG: NDP-sugar synthase [Ilumatobacteraceae bacterium]|nr:NDP-sugar synthase [Ilumatobacteraceae bacterium]
MRAVILVGGFGTRLRPLTFTIPKSLLPVANVSLLEHVIAALSMAGVTEVVLALGFKPEPFLTAFPDGVCAGVSLRYAVEPQPMDTAGAIGFAARFAQINETFIVVNGDILTDLDVSALVDFHRQHGAVATLHLTSVDDPSQYGVVETNDHGVVQRFVEKPQPHETTSRAVNAGTYVLEPSILDYIPLDQPLSVERVVFPTLVAKGALYAMSTDDYWIDTGRPENYLSANLDLIDGSRSRILASIAAQAHIAGTAVITRSVVGDGCRIGAGAIISNSVLLPGAVVDDGARVEASIVMGHIGERATVTDCVIGVDGRVDFGTTHVAEKIPDPATL